MNTIEGCVTHVAPTIARYRIEANGRQFIGSMDEWTFASVPLKAGVHVQFTPIYYAGANIASHVLPTINKINN